MDLMLRRNIMMAQGGGGLHYDAEIEYLESAGTQYINTGFVNSLNTEFSLDFQLTDVTTVDFKIIGQGFKMGLGVLGGRWRLIGTSWISTQFVSDTNRHIASVTSGIYYIDSTNIGDMSAYIDVGTYPWLIFAVSSRNSTSPDGNKCKMKFYSCKIYDNNVLVRDFIPVRIGQVGYMYDKVSGQLFGNSGTGSFTLGPDK